MLSLRDIAAYYPPHLHRFGDFLLREYLQCKILEAVYQSPMARKLVFIGGTCLRIVHGNQRFSEDLDFDSLGCTAAEWEELSAIIGRHLTAHGYQVDMQVVSRQAWHCYVRFPGLLFQEGLSGYRQQKILIQLDVEPQNYLFQPRTWLLNRFDVFTEIFCAPPPLLMSHKCHAILNRKRNKGRDFFDIAFLMGLHLQPDWHFLGLKDGLEDAESLSKALTNHCATLDMNAMANDVAPFLFQPADANKVLHFERLVNQYWGQ